ncbi:alpha/beta hydrolase, partial [Burkholderia sp. SIMBA_024]|uniref:alpha/beta hydrolase n=1 Tax=Burkholderia sp. SIMBA_024 TaxID=3085768 RepID=UPI00397BC2EC
RSLRDGQTPGYVADLATYDEDIAAALDAMGHAIDGSDSRRLVLLGHSWGSFLAQKLVNHHPEAWDAVILSGSALLTPGSLNAAPLNA